jgi:hypothetical protein
VREIDNFYLQKVEPVKGCLLFLRNYILSCDNNITEEWKYKMPFFCYKGKRLCYLWVHKKNGLPYLGIVQGKKLDHPDLIMEGRAKMKIILFDPDKDLPISKIDTILKMAAALY